MGRGVGRTGLGPVVGARRPSYLDSPRVGLFICGEVRRNLRLAYRCAAPRVRLDEGRRSVVPGGGWRLTLLQWHQSTSIEVRFRSHNGDQAQQGSVIVRTRDDAWGPRSGVGAGGGAVALVVELLSGYPTLSESPPLLISQYGNEVRVWMYQEALAALRQVVAKAGDGPSEVALSHCVSVQPLRWRRGGRCRRG